MYNICCQTVANSLHLLLIIAVINKNKSRATIWQYMLYKFMLGSAVVFLIRLSQHRSLPNTIRLTLTKEHSDSVKGFPVFVAGVVHMRLRRIF